MAKLRWSWLMSLSLRAYPNNWRKRACPLGDAKLGLRLDWGNDQSERPQAASSEACWACHQNQSHHRCVPGLRRAVGSAGAPDPRACEHPSVRRGPTAGSRPYLRHWHLLRAAHRLPVESLGRHRICSGSTAHLRFQEWVAAGVFLELWRVGLERYDEQKGLDWSWVSMDGALTKSPLGGGKNRRQPHRPRQAGRQT